MKKLLLAALICLGFSMGGCGTVDSFEQRARRINTIHHLQARMIVDDMDYLMFYDRHSRLTRWATAATGY